MNKQPLLWIFPALATALIINGFLFLLLPLLTHKASSVPDITEPIALNLIQVREQEPPLNEPEEIIEPEPEKTDEPFSPDLTKPELPKMDIPPLPFDINDAALASPQTAFGFDFFFNADELDHAPRPIVKTPPIYPYMAKRKELEGFVKVKFLVDDKGTVSRISILETSPPGIFDESVLKILPSWRFSPGKIFGEPVSSWVVTKVRFELK